MTALSRHGPQLRHGQTSPQLTHLPSTPGAASRNPLTVCQSIHCPVGRPLPAPEPAAGEPGATAVPVVAGARAVAVPASDVAAGVLVPAAAFGGGASQRSSAAPLRPCTASTASTPPSQTDVAGHCPRQRSVTVPSDHSTPSATVPDGRTRWKSLGSGCGVFMAPGWLVRGCGHQV